MIFANGSIIGNYLLCILKGNVDFKGFISILWMRIVSLALEPFNVIASVTILPIFVTLSRVSLQSPAYWSTLRSSIIGDPTLMSSLCGGSLEEEMVFKNSVVYRLSMVYIWCSWCFANTIATKQLTTIGLEEEHTYIWSLIWLNSCMVGVRIVR